MENEKVCVILVETKDDINIGNTVRACKNFGIFDLRLVNPKHADKERISISAPRSKEMIENIKIFPDLESAVADRDRVIGLSARKRYAERAIFEPRAAAESLQDGAKTAFVFGREDRGLTNSELDLCDILVTIPTNPDYTSLNLGQAVLLQMWEVFQFRQKDQKDQSKKMNTLSVTKHRMEKLFSQIDTSLKEIGFYKYGDGTHIRRGLRIFFNRSHISEREFSIFFGIFSEVESQSLRLKKKKSCHKDESSMV